MFCEVAVSALIAVPPESPFRPTASNAMPPCSDGRPLAPERPAGGQDDPSGLAVDDARRRRVPRRGRGHHTEDAAEVDPGEAVGLRRDGSLMHEATDEEKDL